MVSTMASGDSLMDNSSVDSSESGLSGSSQITQSAHNVEHLYQYMNPHSQMSTPPIPPPFINQSPMMDNNMYMQPGPHMNLQPQQMFQLANQMPHMPQSSRLSDDDIMRIAVQLKALLRQDIDELIEVKVSAAIQPLQKELDEVRSEVIKLQQTLKQVITKNDDLEQYSRRSCLRISGIPEEDDEDVPRLVLTLANRVGATIRPNDIDRAHRVGKVKSEAMDDNERPAGINETRSRASARVHSSREIIVKFQNYSARLNLLKGRAVLREAK